MSLRTKLVKELGATALPLAPGPEVNLAHVTDADLEPLRETVRRDLRCTRVVARPRHQSIRPGFTGRFGRSRDEVWMRCEARQYDTRLALARVVYLQLRRFGVVPVLGRPTRRGARSARVPRSLGHGTGLP